MASTSPSSTPCTTPDYTGCSYQSVTLSAGEQFILPPGAVLVSASDINNITSLDNCLDTSNIEELKCYVARVIEYAQGAGGVGTWFEGQTSVQNPQRMPGFTYNGVFYSAAGEQRSFYGGSIYNSSSSNFILKQIQAQIPGIVDYNSVWNQDNSDYNRLNFYQIKTFPSIAENLFINVEAGAEDFHPAYVPYVINFVPRENVDFGTASLASLC
jgi:hypothetical protein